MKTFRSMMSEGSQAEYKKFFDKKLAKFKVKSPAELSDEEKKKFFNEIEKEWTGDKDEEVVKEFIKKDGARRRCAGGDGRKSKKVKTEEEDYEDEEEEVEEAAAQEAWEASLSFESAQSDAVVSLTVTEHTDKKNAKKLLYQAMQDIASDMPQFVKMNKSDITYKKV